MISNLIRQRIGVYYIDTEWKDYIFEQIKEEMKDVIERYSSGRYGGGFIQLKDGSFIKFIYADGSCRGEKFDKMIIDPSIDGETWTTIIRPCHSYVEDYVVKIDKEGTIEDIYYASTYYYREQAAAASPLASR